MTVVIRNYGRAVRAVLNGQTIYREDLVYVPAEHASFYIADTQDHFCYYQSQFYGPVLMCTCGAQAGIYDFGAYQQFQSVNKGKMIFCTHLIEHRQHTDGSVG